MAPGGDSIELLAPVAAPSRLVARAAHTIGEAFAADPYMDLFEIPAAQRAAVFAAMARIVISRSRHQHCLYVAQGGSAVAVVTRSDVQPTPRFLDPYTSGMWWQMIRLPHSSRDAVGAWLQEVRRSSDVLKPLSVGAYLKLVFIATAPSVRGTGAGRELLSRLTADADAAGLPLFLEASATGVARLYESYGFEAVGHLVAKGPGRPGELVVPLMLRRPRPHVPDGGAAASGSSGKGAHASDAAAA